jgi:hypothetical protein
MLDASCGRTFIVADRASLLDGAARLRPALVLVDIALAAGADGVVSKASLATHLYAAIDTVLTGGRYASTGEPH